MILPTFVFQDPRIHQSRKLEIERYGSELKNKQESSIIEAVANKRESVLCCLLKEGSPLEAVSLQKILFQFANNKEYNLILKTLLSKCPMILINARDNAGKTLLYRAVENGHESVTRLLIERGADSSIGDLGGITPLDFAVDKGALEEKTRKNLIGILVNPLQYESNKTIILFKQHPTMAKKCNFAFGLVLKDLFFSYASTPKGRQIIDKMIDKSMTSKKITEYVEKHKIKPASMSKIND